MRMYEGGSVKVCVCMRVQCEGVCMYEGWELYEHTLPPHTLTSNR